jgi:hypothetical protein
MGWEEGNWTQYPTQPFRLRSGSVASVLSVVKQLASVC